MIVSGLLKMDQFIVSARKYRPITFDSVVGQGHVTNTLKNAIKSGHLAQAFLFCGPRGVGKTTSARILAKTVNCLNPSAEMDPCNTCDSCEAFNRQANFSIFELDAASNNSVDDIRALVEQVRYPPQGARYKVYIIDEVHMLSASAFNAFLKTLEEPPSYAIFILATTERHKILPTILSRCQVFDFYRIRQPDIVGQLKSVAEKENVRYEDEALRVIADKADGAMRDALTIFDQMVSYGENVVSYQMVIDNLNILDYEYFFKACDKMATADVPGLLLLLDEIIKRGFDGLTFLTGMAGHFRDLLLATDKNTINILEFSDEMKERYRKQAESLSPAFILNALNIAAQTEMSIKGARNGRLHLELALIKMVYVTEAVAPGEKKKPFNYGDLIAAKPNAKIESQSEPAVEAKHDANTEEKAVSPPMPASESENHSIAASAPLNVTPEPDLNISEPEPIHNQATLAEAWVMIRNELENQGQLRILAFLPAECPAVDANGNLKLVASSSLGEEELLKLKPKIESFLRSHTTSNKLAILIEKNETEMPKLGAYTDKEKFEEMAKQNPNILELRKAFNLDFNH